jgi:diguanylate cyclase (GGDEF)-like protein
MIARPGRLHAFRSALGSPYKSNRLSLYLAVVCAVGLSALVFRVGHDLGQIWPHHMQIAWLAPLIILGEVIPIRVPRGDSYEELTVSTTFAFALLLLAGPASALVAMAVASMISDATRRRPLSRSAFNVAQYSLSLLAAAAVLERLGVTVLTSRAVRLSDLGAFVAAGITFFAVNDALPGIAHALSQGLRGSKIVVFLCEDLPFQAGTAAALISMAPLVVAAANDSLVLVVLLAAPLIAVYRSAMALARTSHEALHDPLTGLANRVQLYRTLTLMLGEGTASSRPFALCLLDLDRFKEVNDSLGHPIGDELLQAVAQRLRSTLGEDDLAVRLGGDEFALLLADTDEAVGRAAALRIGEQLEAPFELSTVTLDIATSIGIALAPTHGDDIEDLLRAADAALYRSKAARCGFLIYDPAAVWEHRSRKPLLADLHRAVEAGEFVAYYQPKADARTRRIVGVETLLRWQHPVHGVLSPVEFLSLLDQSGVIRQVTSDLIDTTIAQLAKWRELGWQLHAAVNVSMRSLHDPDFPDTVAHLLAHYGVPASLLELEVTERTIMADPQRVTSVLGELKAIGATIALDDFGTGYSSLAHLSKMPLDVLKIDQSFVRNMATSAKDSVIVRSTIELARNLELATVGEGVEDELTWAQLRTLGCDTIQGYIISRPKPVDELTQYLQCLPQLALPQGALPHLVPPPSTS